MKNRRFFCIVILIICLLLFLPNNIIAAETVNMYDIYSTTQNETLSTAVAQILGVINAIGYAAAVIMLTYIGIKFLWTSPEGKADLKKQLFPYIIGVLILFGGGTIAGILANYANKNLR